MSNLTIAPDHTECDDCENCAVCGTGICDNAPDEDHHARVDSDLPGPCCNDCANTIFTNIGRY